MSASRSSKRPLSEVVTEPPQQSKRVTRSSAGPNGAIQGHSAASQGTEEDSRARDRERAIRQSERRADIVKLEKIVKAEITQVLDEVADLSDGLHARLMANETRFSRIEAMLEQLLTNTQQPRKGTSTSAPAPRLPMAGSVALGPSGTAATPAPECGAPCGTLSYAQGRLMDEFEEVTFDGDYTAYNCRFDTLVQAADPVRFSYTYMKTCYLAPLPLPDQKFIETGNPKTMKDLYAEAESLYIFIQFREAGLERTYFSILRGSMKSSLPQTAATVSEHQT
ncbi:hypothetical protein BCV69DRAFT_285299 [Microstroma glucosiphilum]|uniref:Uncharacterized protein n=1 Tax=Pseudomicrostroma glucosiphilum TaxID=1684307 RepID=A0A316U1G5_9BASI|nr:hypothetical protein BCV69DRAFT_285299 [Pseudomicrostroma glucosiphilum]PWN18331.1 hypothetical protein BCV69DRAFT_285299 [Pseudomicrostroma glucosiphilum]